MNTQQIKPFLKWAGGKTQILEAISSKFPFSKMDKFTYIEPFLGSGAVLFWVLNNFPNLEAAVVNDINADLVNTYRVISNFPEELIAILKAWEQEFHKLSEKEAEKKVYYYQKRECFNKRDEDPLNQAALLIFLNKTCFNGLYRVNQKNEFNVPIGSYKTPKICDEGNLREVSRALRKVTILNGDFEETLGFAKGKTLYYLDPPYKPLNITSNFNSYSKDQFDDSEQIRLKTFCDNLTEQGHKWILSNSDVKGANPSDEFFDNLYRKYNISRVLAKRSINSNALKRGQLTELLICNE